MKKFILNFSSGPSTVLSNGQLFLPVSVIFLRHDLQIV